MGNRKIFKKKTIIPKFLKKSSMKLTFNKKSHTEISFCVCQDPKNTFLIGPQRKNKKIDSQTKIAIFYENYIFMIFLKKRHWSPRMAEKWVWESVERPRGGLWAIYFFYKKSYFLFSILIDSPGFPGFPGVPRGSPGIPGIPGGAWGPLKTLKTLTIRKILKNLKNHENPKKIGVA